MLVFIIVEALVWGGMLKENMSPICWLGSEVSPVCCCDLIGER